MVKWTLSQAHPVCIFFLCLVDCHLHRKCISPQCETVMLSEKHKLIMQHIKFSHVQCTSNVLQIMSAPVQLSCKNQCVILLHVVLLFLALFVVSSLIPSINQFTYYIISNYLFKTQNWNYFTYIIGHMSPWLIEPHSVVVCLNKSWLARTFKCSAKNKDLKYNHWNTEKIMNK